MKRGKLVKLEGVTLPDGQVKREVKDDGYTYFRVVELDKIKDTCTLEIWSVVVSICLVFFARSKNERRENNF